MAGAHAHALGHLVKRSAEFVMQPATHASNTDFMKAFEGQVSKEPIFRPREVVLFALTAAFFILTYISLQYTIGEVVAALTMIEQPRSAVVLAEPEYQDSAAPKTRTPEEELVILKEKPITSSIRGTLRHLRTVGGFRSRFRGFSVFLVYTIASAILTNVFGSLLNFLPIWTGLAMSIGSIISTLCLVRIHMTWTHIVISEPSPLRWYRRIPRGRTYFKALLTPALIFAIAQYLTVAMPLLVFGSFGAPTSVMHPNEGNKNAKRELARLLATLGTAIFVAIAVYLPAIVTLTRVEASLLPDDAETIVNFDRTLGGAAANLVGFGKINFVALYDAAWRSFDKASRFRLITFYIKYNLMMIGLCLLFIILFVAEVLVIGLPRLQNALQAAAA